MPIKKINRSVPLDSPAKKDKSDKKIGRLKKEGFNARGKEAAAIAQSDGISKKRGTLKERIAKQQAQRKTGNGKLIAIILVAVIGVGVFVYDQYFEPIFPRGKNHLKTETKTGEKEVVPQKSTKF